MEIPNSENEETGNDRIFVPHYEFDFKIKNYPPALAFGKVNFLKTIMEGLDLDQNFCKGKGGS